MLPAALPVHVQPSPRSTRSVHAEVMHSARGMYDLLNRAQRAGSPSPRGASPRRHASPRAVCYERQAMATPRTARAPVVAAVSPAGADRAGAVGLREAEVATRETVVANREVALQHAIASVREQQAECQRAEALLKAREAELAAREGVLAQREAYLANLEAARGAQPPPPPPPGARVIMVDKATQARGDQQTVKDNHGAKKKQQPWTVFTRELLSGLAQDVLAPAANEDPSLQRALSADVLGPAVAAFDPAAVPAPAAPKPVEELALSESIPSCDVAAAAAPGDQYALDALRREYIRDTYVTNAPSLAVGTPELTTNLAAATALAAAYATPRGTLAEQPALPPASPPAHTTSPPAPTPLTAAHAHAPAVSPSFPALSAPADAFARLETKPPSNVPALAVTRPDASTGAVVYSPVPYPPIHDPTSVQ